MGCEIEAPIYKRDSTLYFYCQKNEGGLSLGCEGIVIVGLDTKMHPPLRPVIRFVSHDEVKPRMRCRKIRTFARERTRTAFSEECVAALFKVYRGGGDKTRKITKERHMAHISYRGASINLKNYQLNGLRGCANEAKQSMQSMKLSASV